LRGKKFFAFAVSDSETPDPLPSFSRSIGNWQDGREGQSAFRLTDLADRHRRQALTACAPPHGRALYSCPPLRGRGPPGQDESGRSREGAVRACPAPLSLKVHFHERPFSRGRYAGCVAVACPILSHSRRRKRFATDSRTRRADQRRSPAARHGKRVRCLRRLRRLGLEGRL
jgi:hypothetical protein